MKRRAFIKTLGPLLALAAGALNVKNAWSTPVPRRTTLVGAIRWDAWYAPRRRVGLAVENSLGPERYHSRLPFFATVEAPDRVVIDGAHQPIMDREIELAVQAGIDYWAFDMYPFGSEMNVALDLYLASASRGSINFCLLSGLDLWESPETLERHVGLMCQAGYQRVLDRPLYYLGSISNELVSKMGGDARVNALLAGFRAAVKQCANAEPYLVILDDSAEDAAKFARAFGADAISSYGVNRNRHQATFDDLQADDVEQWEAQRATGVSVVPTLTTGADRRPRYDHPVFWENQGAAWPDYYEEIYAAAPTSRELAAHLRYCLAWLKTHADAAPAQTALLYAWNENDQGGWLIPTYPFDRSRLDAVTSVLRASPNR